MRFLVGLCVCLFACGGFSQADVQDQEEAAQQEADDFASSPAYTAGLADVLADADEDTAPVLRSSFRAGFATGRVEAGALQQLRTEEELQMGCYAGSAEVLKAGQVPGPAELCRQQLSGRFTDARFQGREYGQGKLAIVERTTRLGAASVRSLILSAFDAGYLAGFRDTGSGAVPGSFVVGCHRAVLASSAAGGELLRVCEARASQRAEQRLGVTPP